MIDVVRPLKKRIFVLLKPCLTLFNVGFNIVVFHFGRPQKSGVLASLF